MDQSLRIVLLEAAGQRSLDGVLATLVDGLGAQTDIALARVWLLRPGDICDECPMRSECPDQTRCLHLVASRGSPSNADENWSRTSGRFRRIPLGARKIGRVGATGEPILLKRLEIARQWLARPEWAAREGLRSFAAHPLLFRDEILGVLGVFSRAYLDEHDFTWLRVFADHAAAAIASARAFEEIEALRAQLQHENVYLREEVEGALAHGEIIGDSKELRAVLHKVEMVAPTDANVLIEGESGTGKELIARAIHRRSSRRDRPMIKVNCASVPRELFESEFFGHVKGAFTGAMKDRVGRFQLADKGTLFLDELGEIPLELQSKLLRVLQEGEFERVGSERPSKVNVRIIAATNRDLTEEMGKGRFREDLYFRISVFPVEIPPLRERREDIAPLARHFLATACEKLGKPALSLRPEHVSELRSYPWPGNARELQNVIERAVITSRRGELTFALPARAPAEVRESASSQGEQTAAAPPSAEVDPLAVPGSLAEVKALEKQRIVDALQSTGGKIYGPGGAADLLGIKPTTLASRLKSLGIKKPS